MCIETGDGGIRDLKSYPTVQDAVNDGHMTERARCVAICAAIISAGDSGTWQQIMQSAVECVTRAEEWDRHERLQKP